KTEPPAAQPEARRRTASSPANNQDADFHDWASDFKGSSTDTKTGLDSRQREAKLRQAKELKELEKELLGETATSVNAETQAQAQAPAPQAQARRASPFPGPVGLSPARTANHYFPSQGGTSNRMGGQR